MFSFTTFLLFLASTPVYSTFTPLLDAATLLKNGQEAQRLNALFQVVTASDCCADGDKACVDGAIALCRNGEWDTTSGRCATLQTCFAVPDIRNAGAILSCTSEQSAVSAITATGATGGIFGRTNTTSSSMASSAFTPTVDTPAAVSLSALQAVTTTVTLNEQVTTLPPQTRTLSPQEAFSVLASLLADGAIIVDASSATSMNCVATPTLDTQSAEATSKTATLTTDQPSDTARLGSAVATPSPSSANECL